MGELCKIKQCVRYVYEKVMCEIYFEDISTDPVHKGSTYPLCKTYVKWCVRKMCQVTKDR